MLSNGQFSVVNAPGAATTDIYGINSQAQMVGTWAASGQPTQGFVYSSGKFTTLSDPQAAVTVPMAINDLGQIVGYYLTSGSNQSQGFLYSNGVFKTIDFPGLSTELDSISNKGQIVGQVIGNPSADMGLTNSSGTFTGIEVPGLTANRVGLNDAGEIVGSLVSGNPPYSLEHGFVLSGGSLTLIDAPNAMSPYGTTVVGINDLGELVGTEFVLIGGTNIQAFVAASPMPAPETASLPLLIAGLACLAALGRSRWELFSWNKRSR